MKEKSIPLKGSANWERYSMLSGVMHGLFLFNHRTFLVWNQDDDRRGIFTADVDPMVLAAADAKGDLEN